jgi:hypothetical protein
MASEVEELIRSIQLGSSIAIFWRDDRAWYTGTVQRKSPSSIFTVAYEDGEVESLDLLEETFRVNDPSVPAPSAHVAHSLQQQHQQQHAAGSKRKRAGKEPAHSQASTRSGNAARAPAQRKRSQRTTGGVQINAASRAHTGQNQSHNQNQNHVPPARPPHARLAEGASTVKEWLHALGLDKYAPFFDMNEIDMEVLPTLTLDDLRDVPVKAVGPRRKMLNAIEVLRHNQSNL